MRKSQFSEEQIIPILGEMETGCKFLELCRKHNVIPNTFYKWKAKFGGMIVSEAEYLRALEEENTKLKTMLAEGLLDKRAFKDVVSKKW
ncbi:transposase [Candidatus Protochlamydia sp. W-9]|uniref:transposase n=1 Tax=Candidatus Protochlamydia sp. W-9 TaxID=1785087 RepID=UPI00096AC435|nr:transposase [Candidatus Protochlamydia sp. W-9]